VDESCHNLCFFELSFHNYVLGKDLQALGIEAIKSATTPDIRYEVLTKIPVFSHNLSVTKRYSAVNSQITAQY
jgi:hypothetical protein